MRSGNELHAHYAQLLGLQAPWKVSSVDFQPEQRRIDIAVEWRSGHAVSCPECGRDCRLKDHLKERSWRHLDTMQFETRIRSRLPRADCPEHGVKTVKVPWAEPGSGFTALFERFVIDVLFASQSIEHGRNLLGLGWEQVHRIMERAVSRGMSRRELKHLEYVGLDETSFAKGRSYVSLMSDLEGGRVLEVMKGADSEAADFLWASLPEEQLNEIKAVAMDMSSSFESSTRQAVPEADIVHDKFHVSQHLNEAVKKIFRQENKSLQNKGDERLKYTRQLWLMNEATMNDDQRASFEALKKMTLKVSRGWAIKELFAEFWTYTYQGSARKFFKKWFGWASRSQLGPIIRVAKMLKRHFENIITYLKHPITNAVTEGLNNKIQSLKNNARGFRSFHNYRIRILFFCGGLSLYPQ
jgi:transposase